MSHEAAVGKIAQEQIEYLMSRGLSEEEAISVIVRGFLRVDIEGLPAELKAELDKARLRGIPQAIGEGYLAVYSIYKYLKRPYWA